jgi:hypothetical protein
MGSGRYAPRGFRSEVKRARRTLCSAKCIANAPSARTARMEIERASCMRIGDMPPLNLKMRLPGRGGNVLRRKPVRLNADAAALIGVVARKAALLVRWRASRINSSAGTPPDPWRCACFRKWTEPISLGEL